MVTPIRTVYTSFLSIANTTTATVRTVIPTYKIKPPSTFKSRGICHSDVPSMDIHGQVSNQARTMGNKIETMKRVQSCQGISNSKINK
jgi:hypothetical protein